MSDDVEEVFLIFFAIEKSESYAWVAESARSSNTVQVTFIVWEMILRGDIEVDDKLYCVHVKTSRENIRCDNHIDLSFSELFDAFVSFFLGQFAEHNKASVTLLIQSVIDIFSKTNCIDENDSLRVIIESLEDFHNVINLFASIALVIELLNVVQLDWLYLHCYLNGILDDFWDLLAYFLFVGGWEKDELDLVLQFFDSFNEWVQLLLVPIVQEKGVGFVKHEHS